MLIIKVSQTSKLQILRERKQCRSWLNIFRPSISTLFEKGISITIQLDKDQYLGHLNLKKIEQVDFIACWLMSHRWQNGKLLLYEQSDLGLYYLFMHFCPNIFDIMLTCACKIWLSFLICKTALFRWKLVFFSHLCS